MKDEELFHQVLDQPPQQRDAFLDAACGGDAGLRARIQSLLQAHANPGSFLQSPGDAAFAPTITEGALLVTPGTVIGPYKLLEQIGEGGFGIVFMAEQTEPVKRKVALKVIKPGMDTRQVIARFEVERQALALMDHPNIAKVFDAGATETGRPYFVMELVRGVPITEYCDQAHLSPRERLELFVTVCQAVQHAHQKGIIHRDLKPSNILIARYDDRAVPKIIDFGVAKAISQKLTEKTMFTQYGQIVGTIEYMSPEQAQFNQLDVDTRSDVYSLGVLLYELLTGETPFDRQRLRSAAFDELLRIIREEEPLRPSAKLSSSQMLPSIAANRKTEPTKLSGVIRGELDWIVMKSLEKDRTGRYETANAFARDVQRYLSDESVEACPPSAAYRFRKFARRNRTALNMSAVVAVLILLAVGSIGWIVRDRSVREKQVANERADRQIRLTNHVSSLLEEVGRFELEQKWAEALATVQRAHEIAAGGEVEPRVQVQLVQQLHDLEFIAKLEEARLERATGRAGDLDNWRGAVAYGQAFREFGIDLEQLPPDEAVSRLQGYSHIAAPLAAAIDDFAEIRRELSGATDPGFLALVSIARGLDPDPTRDRLRGLWVQPESPDSMVEWQALIESLDDAHEFPASLSLLGRALWRVGLTEESLSLLRQAQEHHPDDFWINFELALRLHQSKDFSGAIRYYSVAIALRPTASVPHNNLGVVYFKEERHDEAAACFRRAIELDPESSISQFNLGRTLYSAKRWADSVEAYQKAIDIDPLNAGLYHLLALSQKELGRIDEADESLTKSIEYYQRDTKLAPRDSTLHYNLANAQFELQRFDDAVASLSRAVELNPENAYATSLLAAWLTGTPELLDRDPARAVKLACRATELEADNYLFWKTLGMAHYRAGHWTEAIAAMEKSCRLESATNGNGNAWQWLFLAMAHWQLGNREEARKWYGRSLDIEHVWPEELTRYRTEAEELMGEWLSSQKLEQPLESQ